MWIRWISLIAIVLSSHVVLSQRNNDIQLANEYYSTGELDKAREIYEQVIQNPRAIPLVHNNYLMILLDQEEFDEADKYLRKTIKLVPNNDSTICLYR